MSEASGEILQCEPSDPSDWSNPAPYPQMARMENVELVELVEFTLELVNVCCSLYEIRHPGKESRIVLVIFH